MKVMLLFLAFLPALPAPAGVSLDQFTVRQGLTHNFINAVVVDSLGFLWIATPDGLNRYDGYAFAQFRHDYTDTSSLPANSVQALLVDARGSLWVGTFNGLCRYDPSANAFIRYRLDRGSAAEQEEYSVSALCADGDGALWVATDKGVFLIPRGETALRSAGSRIARFPVAPGAFITSIIPDPRPDNRTLWFATTDRGMIGYDPEHQLASRIFRPPANRMSFFRQYTQGALTLLNNIASRSRTIAGLVATADNDTLDAAFRITRQSRVMVICVGEGIASMADCGWIERADGVRVQETTIGKSLHAGGAPKNRISVSLIDISPGEYRARYVTDDSHSPAAWNEPPPTAGFPWGIRAWQLAAADVPLVEQAIAATYIPRMLTNNAVYVLRNDTAGSCGHAMLAGTGNGAIDRICFSSDGTISIENVVQLPPERQCPIPAMMVDRRGRFWIGSRGGGILGVTDTDTLSTDEARFVSSMVEDRSGNIWFGTNAGLMRLNPRRMIFTQCDDVERTDSPRISAVYEDRSGRVYVGLFSGGLKVLEGQSLALPGHSAASLAGDVVRSMCEVTSQPGVLWIGTYGDGLVSLDVSRGITRRFRMEPGNPATIGSNHINSIAPDNDGSIWIGTDNGLNLFDPSTGSNRRINPAPGDTTTRDRLLSGAVWVVRPDRDPETHAVWVGTVGGGLSRYDAVADTFRHFNEHSLPALGNRTIPSLLQEPSGALWIGTYSDGLNLLDSTMTSVMRFTVHDGLPNNTIQGIAPDAGGMLWLATNNGLCRFDPASRRIQIFDERDGVAGSQFGMNTITRLHSGSILVGGVDGLTLFDPRMVSWNENPAEVVLTSFSIPGVRELPVRFFTGERAMTLQHTENFISFEFLALELTHPERIRYSCMMEGVDREWVDTRTRRSATYANLAPGSYTFRVRAMDSNGLRSEPGVVLALTVTPPYWQRWWFLTGTGIVFVLAGAFGYRARVRSQVRRRLELEWVRQEEHERVRNRTARDFHDEMGHRLTRISMLSELARRKIGESPAEVRTLLDTINENAHQLFNGTRDFIWSLDTRNDTLFDMAVRLKDFGDELFFGTGIAFQVRGIGEEFSSIRLVMEFRRQVMFIFKEAMTNAMRHAGCTIVVLEFSTGRSTLGISLADNGKGLAQEKCTRGTGIANMIARAQKIDGTLTILPAVARGTVVSFSGPVPMNGVAPHPDT